MIVVSNRVSVPDERVETFVDRLKENHGIEEQPGFCGLKLLEPVDAPGFITMTFWDSLDDYEAWRDGEAFERAHSNRSAQETFEEQNDVEIHEVIVNRTRTE
jgi:heme-degrading monooxygenase HmoA